MFDSAVLNVVISLVFIYLLYSLLATTIQEIFASVFKMRAQTLKKGIRRMLDDDSSNKELSNLFYSHPLIQCLGAGKNKKPSYLTAQNFSKVVVDLLRGQDPKPGKDFASAIQNSIDESKTQWISVKIMPSTNIFLKSLWADSQGDIEKFKTSLEKWFDDTMEHVTGWYKRKTQLFLFLIGIGLSFFFNVDTISIIKKLSGNPVLTKQLVDNASVYMDMHNKISNHVSPQPVTNIQYIDTSKRSVLTAKDLKENQTELNQHMAIQKSDSNYLHVNINLVKSATDIKTDSIQLQLVKQSARLIDSANTMVKEGIANTNNLLGLGWSYTDAKGQSKICISQNFTRTSIIGWLLTAIAISMGAPFWFDLLSKFMQLRATGRKPEDRPATVSNNTTATENTVG